MNTVDTRYCICFLHGTLFVLRFALVILNDAETLNKILHVRYKFLIYSLSNLFTHEMFAIIGIVHFWNVYNGGSLYSTILPVYIFSAIFILGMNIAQCF